MVTSLADRRGRGRFGCLFTLVLLGVLLYVGIAFGRPWFAYQQFRQEMRTVLSRHESVSDSVIIARIRARADSLRLPPEARRVVLERLPSPPRIEVRSTYEVTVDLPIVGPKVLTFEPRAEEEL